MKRRAQDGQSLVEFAVIAPALTTLVLGVFHFGYPLYVYTDLQDAISRGARYASSATYASSSFSPPDAGFTTAVRNVVVFGRPDGGGTPIARGLATNQVIVTVLAENGAPMKIKIAISGYSLPLPFGTLTFINKPAVTMRYTGRFAPG